MSYSYSYTLSAHAPESYTSHLVCRSVDLSSFRRSVDLSTSDLSDRLTEVPNQSSDILRGN